MLYQFDTFVPTPGMFISTTSVFVPARCIRSDVPRTAAPVRTRSRSRAGPHPPTPHISQPRALRRTRALLRSPVCALLCALSRAHSPVRALPRTLRSPAPSRVESRVSRSSRVESSIVLLLPNAPEGFKPLVPVVALTQLDDVVLGVVLHPDPVQCQE